MKTQTRVTLVWGQRSHISSPDKGPFLTNVRIPHSNRKLVMTQMSVKQALDMKDSRILLRFTDGSVGFIHTLDPRCIKKVKVKLDRAFEGHSLSPEVTISDNTGVAISAPIGRNDHWGRDQSFCKSALVFAKQVFDALGIEDVGNVQLANFHLGQTTYVYVSSGKRGWISYSHYLRYALGLPTDVLDVD